MRDSRMARAVIVAGLLLLVLSPATTLATWSDDAALPAAPVHTAVLDLRVDDRDALGGLDVLDRSGLLPGDVTTAIFTVTNAGTAPLDYTVSLSGTGPLAGAVVLGLRSAVDDRCGSNLPAAPRPLAPGEGEPVCVELTLPTGAAPSLAGLSVDLDVTVRGTNGGWSDQVPLLGTTWSTVALTAPTLSCGPLGLLLGVHPVPGATAYQLLDAAGRLLTSVPGADLSKALSTVLGVVSVRAVFGSDAWVSDPVTCG